MKGVEFRFLEPVDVLFLRGNKGYGDPGSYGESYVPPWPSVIAGALRSRILAGDGFDLAAFAEGKVRHPAIGTPEAPGACRVVAFHLARRWPSGQPEALVLPPADLVITKAAQFGQHPPVISVHAMRPVPLPGAGDALLDSYPLPLRPVLAEKSRLKPAGGYWLTEHALRAYLAGRLPEPGDLVEAKQLWQTEPRVGVGLDPGKRSAYEGRLFTAEAVAMARRILPQDAAGFDVGFLVGVAGCAVPREGMLRVGGDGRAMALRALDEYAFPEPDYEAISRARRCRMILASPGVFAHGWLPTGVERVDGEWRFELYGVRARLVAACVPRAEWISGWDLARERPKPARRAAPAGSVYWLDDLEASAEQLRALVEGGLWSELYMDPIRRAEGFNRIWLAEWMKEE